MRIGVEDSSFAATGAIAGPLFTSFASEFASWAVRLAVHTLTGFTSGSLSEDLCVRLTHSLAGTFETVVSHVGLTTLANRRFELAGFARRIALHTLILEDASPSHGHLDSGVGGLT